LFVPNYRYPALILLSTLLTMSNSQLMDRNATRTALIALFLLGRSECWILAPPLRSKSFDSVPTFRQSTPFEAEFYDNLYDESSQQSSLAVSPDTKLVIGLNKYSHDTAICAADAESGKVLFAASKERMTRFKHDSGNAAILVETCLGELNLQLDNIQKVVMNNHHHRILPLESNLRHMEWESGLQINGGLESGYDEPENLLTTSERHELSHHLAHAYSTATQAPFDSGICVVMDGMGETYRTMQRAVESGDTQYTSDFSFGVESFQCLPSDIAALAARSYFDWREAESVYTFTKTETSIDLRPVFKRFTQENSPPTLYNHGFENMDSIGAVYSRASSHIFGDWNACGKVMGLAPWANYVWTDDAGKLHAPTLHETPILAGSLYSEEEGKKFMIDRSLLEGVPHIARNDPDLYELDGTQKKRYDFDDNDDTDEVDAAEKTTSKRLPISVALDAIALAYRIQDDLEAVVMDFVQHFKEKTGEKHLCVAGGVALNSVLNGRLARELGFEQTFISPYPGDDGIAVGCCAFGLFGNHRLEAANNNQGKQPPVWREPISPYLGPDPSDLDMKMAIDAALPWLDIDVIRDDDQRVQIMAQEVETGAVVAWYRSRSEIGPRALGHRSILADPRKKGLVRFINEHVKGRESFRPFAPSVLAEEVVNWFDVGDAVPADGNLSPFMSMTASVHEDKRARIPAVTHVDGSSRLQTVTKEAEPLYHKFIAKFFEITGVPMVLNTSFNTMPSEPIVETPSDAIRSFMYSMGSIDMLVLGDYVIRRKQPDLRKLLGETTKDGDMVIEPAYPTRAGPVNFQSSFDLGAGPTDEESVLTTTRVQMPDRPMHGYKNEWVELLDELEGEILSVCDGTVTLNDIMAQYSASPEGEEVGEEGMEANQNLLQNIVHRFVRLYEQTLISW
jgi:predicted NodU family carbamoyl transferase